MTFCLLNVTLIINMVYIQNNL